MNSNRNKKLSIIAIAILVLGVAGLLFLRNDSYEIEGPDALKVEPRGDEIEVAGTVACLPFRVNIPEEDCVKAIKGDDGKIYALDTINVRGIENLYPIGAEVIAIGTFEPANKSIDESSGFTYDGVLTVRSIQPR